MKKQLNLAALFLIMPLVFISTIASVGLAQQDQTGTPEQKDDSAQPQVESQEQSTNTEQTPAVEPVPPAEQAASSAENASVGGLISIDFKDADIRQVLRIISLKSGVDIVAGTDVEGLVSIKLTNVPWEQALDIILRTYGFSYERKGNIVRVMTTAALEQEALATDVFPLDYAKAKEVPDVIKEMLSDRGKVKFDERTNTIIVTDIPANLFQIKQVIERLDQRTPQALIEARIVETKLNKNENLGITWSSSLTLTQTQNSIPSSFPFVAGSSWGKFGDKFIGHQQPGEYSTTVTSLLTQNPATTLGSVGIGTLSTSALSSILNFLQSRTDTHIVSNPTIAVLNNQEAKVHIGSEYPIPSYTIEPTTGKTTISGFSSKNIGTVLTVTPHINQSNEIVVDVKPEVITASDKVAFDTGQGSSVSLPQFTIQTAETKVRIESGETIAIGGLVKETEQKKEVKVPILGDIPIFGWLFKNVSKYEAVGGSDPVRQDLLIFLTVHLMEEQHHGQSVATATKEKN